ncbi:hypothetical protein [Streptomyces sp. NPDC059515]|uniref:hypothetical protein n=1 Tax=Streptomyces sp. NPDC059515 TaxID=3346854 RepID=UPI0036D15584
MKITVEATACDLDKEMPARTYGITVDGESHEMDLCAPHAKPIEDLIEKARQAREQASAPAAKAVPPMQFNPPTPPPPRRSAARQTETPTPRKRAGGRRPKITSLAEIEAQKKTTQQDQD